MSNFTGSYKKRVQLSETFEYYLKLLNLLSVFLASYISLFNFRYFSFFLAKSYHLEAATGSFPQIPQNKRLLANTNFDKIFDRKILQKYLTGSLFVIRLQALNLTIH